LLLASFHQAIPIAEYDIFNYYPQCEITMDMGMCAASWAIVVTKAMSLSTCISQNLDTPISLSPQNLINCSQSTNQNPCIEYKDSFLLPNALLRAQTNGINNLSTDGYSSFVTGVKGTCDTKEGSIKIKSYARFDNTTGDVDHELMKTKISNNQPLIATIKLTPSL